MSDNVIQVKGIVKRYGHAMAVNGVSFDVRQGEFVSLLGPSGCGKTTTLRMIAGFVDPSGGTIHVHGRDVTHLPPEKRNVGFVFQNYALWPHMTVAENVAFGLRLRKKRPAFIRQKIEESLGVVGLAGYESRLPRHLSGGQQQRVALARALALEPELLLMDEPLSNLDRALRVTMRRELKELQSKMKMTTLYVTHDQEEALSLSNRVVIMNKGNIEQIAAPHALYEAPCSPFVADFVGITNFLDGFLVSQTADAVTLQLQSGLTIRSRQPVSLPEGARIMALLRPERIKLLTERPLNEDNILSGVIVFSEYYGAVVRYSVQLAQGNVLRAEVHNFDKVHHNGCPVWLGIDPDYLRIIPFDGER
ncbi:Putative protein transporter, ATPase [Sodalis praecaptivus]|uniref:ABC transporter domain-containing protein n=1 Tax=Sodalis praecaptivus TaxID=1239307 RepID=W0HS53_9GAMM|nr:ABC transporter ATP-binding protein [Sodalis praecaptivus]AHF76661.1 Putative protein transporter, ATPase [Sodalis praecaptivus]